MPGTHEFNVVSASERFMEKMKRWSEQRRLHITNTPLILGEFPKNPHLPSIGKPGCGLWYGINESWIEWCHSEMSHWLQPYIYEILVDESKILTIKDVDEFEAFEDKFAHVPGFDPDFCHPDVLKNNLRNFYSRIHWGKVADLYGGIEISPYRYEKRLTSMWYYGMDVACGCIWSKDAIKGIELFASYDPIRDEFI